MSRRGGSDQKIKNVLRNLTTEQFTELLASLKPSELADVRRKLHFKGELECTEASATKLRSMLLLGVRKGWPVAFANVVTQGPRDIARTVLGDALENPDEGQTRHAIGAVMDQYGAPLTSLWIALMLTNDARATSHIIDVYSEIPELHDLLNSDTRTTPTPSISTAPMRNRKDRSSERFAKREQRRKKLEADQRSRERNTRFKKRRPEHELSPDTDDTNSPTPSVDVPEPPMLIYPHLGRWPKANPRHELVGSVVNVFIQYTSPRFAASTKADGKLRPSVVLAVDSRHLIVKPLYSEPRFGAGHWRAIEIIDWRSAGLHRKSWAGDEVHRARMTNEPFGRLSIADWNRICRGEVNNA